MKTIGIIPLLAILIFTLSCKDKDGNSPLENCCGTEPIVDSVGLAKVFIPNAFTPDKNGINDYLYVFNNGLIKEIKLMQVFDSDGILVFENQNFDDFYSGWDGKVDGEDRPGLYSYKITIESDDAVTKTFEGEVCSLPCSPSIEKLPTFENVEDCLFGLQHNGNGVYDLDLDNGEALNCLE